MIDMDFMSNLIAGIMVRFKDEREEECNRSLRRKYTVVEDNEVIEFTLDDEIRTALNCLNIKNCVSGVPIRKVGESKKDIWVICVSYTLGNEPHQFIISTNDY